MRQVMNGDADDDGLIDVSRIALRDLGDQTDETALDRALRKILTGSDERERHNFQAII